MEKKNAWTEFLTTLETRLDELTGSPHSQEMIGLDDEDARLYDEVMARWIAKIYPAGGFNFEPEKRNLAIKILKQAKSNDISADYVFYLDTLFWLAFQNAGKHPVYAARNIFLLGVAFGEITTEGKNKSTS